MVGKVRKWVVLGGVVILASACSGGRPQTVAPSAEPVAVTAAKLVLPRYGFSVAAAEKVEEGSGVLVVDTEPVGLASVFGLRVGDRVEGIGTSDIHTPADLLGFYNSGVDMPARIRILRGSRRLLLEMVGAGGALPKPSGEGPEDLYAVRGRGSGQSPVGDYPSGKVAAPPPARPTEQSQPQDGGQGAGPAVGVEADFVDALMPTPDLAERKRAAYALLQGGELKSAVEAYGDLVREYPHNADLYNDLGVALNRLGSVEEALSAFDRAASLDPTGAKSHFNRGVALWTLGHIEDARISYRIASTLDPNFTLAHLAESDALQQIGRLEEALTINNRSLQWLGPTSTVMRQRGSILLELEQMEGAEAALREALALTPEDPGLSLDLGICLDEQGRHSEAVEVFERVLELNPRHVAALHNRAQALFALGEWQSALDSEESALVQDRDFLAAWIGRAHCLEKLGRIEELVAAWGEVLERQPAHPEAIRFLEMTAGELASSPAGVEHIQRLLHEVGCLSGEPDGDYGPETTQAVSAFQSAQGLRVTGRLNGLTLHRLTQVSYGVTSAEAG